MREPRQPEEYRMGEPWLVWSNEHRAFWASNRCGYTGAIEKAGRYSRQEAEAICRSACPRANSTIYEGQPPEICMPAPEALDNLKAEYQRGYAEGIEAAAKVADDHVSDAPIGLPARMVKLTAERIAEAVRALVHVSTPSEE